MRLDDVEFVEEIFCLVKRVIDRLKKRENKDHDEICLQSFSHSVIDFMHNHLNRTHVRCIARIIHTILYADPKLANIDHVRQFWNFSIGTNYHE